VFVELDTRQDAGYTVSREWDEDTDNTQMTVAHQLEHQSVVPIESSISLGTTRTWSASCSPAAFSTLREPAECCP
jgi:hypothetical protein